MRITYDNLGGFIICTLNISPRHEMSFDKLTKHVNMALGVEDGTFFTKESLKLLDLIKTGWIEISENKVKLLHFYEINHRSTPAMTRIACDIYEKIRNS